MQMVSLEGGRARAAVRRKVLLRGRMRGAQGASFTAICVRDVSPRGMLLQTNAPPPRGMVIEVYVAHQLIIARVIWAGDRRFGVMTRDRVDIASLLGEPGTSLVSVPDRGRAAPPRRAPTAEESRETGRWFQFAAMGVACAGAGAGFALGLHGMLRDVVAKVVAGFVGG